jgi:hypothetical protein
MVFVHTFPHYLIISLEVMFKTNYTQPNMVNVGILEILIMQK